MRTGARIAVGPAGGDLVLGGTGLEFDSGLATAVLASLLADARARPEDVAGDPRQGWRRGWWPDTDSDRFGSRLWTLARAKRVPEVLRRAELIATEALEWLRRDGIVASLEVLAEFDSHGQLALRVELRRGFQRRWSYLWDSLAQGTYMAEGFNVQLVAAT
jgi:phage gp46-like protein